MPKFDIFEIPGIFYLARILLMVAREFKLELFMKTLKVAPILFLTMAVAVLASCGKKSNDNSNTAVNPITVPSLPPVYPGPITGDFNSYCAQTGGTLVTVSGMQACKTTYQISNMNFSCYGWGYPQYTCSTNISVAAGDYVVISKSGKMSYLAVGGSQIGGAVTSFVSPSNGPIVVGDSNSVNITVNSISVTRCQAQNGQTLYCP